MISGDPFQSFINFLLRPDIEGVSSMDPSDPGNWTGGAKNKGKLAGTKYGISAAAYPNVDIQTLNPETVKGIYFADYWCKAGCHLLPPALAFLTGDAAVQHGAQQAVQFLQRALRVDDDGVVGPVTLAAARNSANSAIDGALAERMRYYMNIKDDAERKTNAGGWSNRMIAVCREVM